MQNYSTRKRGCRSFPSFWRGTMKLHTRKGGLKGKLGYLCLIWEGMQNLCANMSHLLLHVYNIYVWIPIVPLKLSKVFIYSQSIIRPKKNNCCVALMWDFWKSWVGRSEILFFFNNFFKKHPKGPNLGAYSIIFLKKHPIWAKLGAFPTLLIFIFE